MINQGRLQELQKLLEQEKEELLAVVERLTGPGGLETPADEADWELSAYDNHPADYGSQMYERSKDLGLLQAARKQLAEVAEAQEAIRKGSYGIRQLRPAHSRGAASGPAPDCPLRAVQEGAGNGGTNGAPRGGGSAAQAPRGWFAGEVGLRL